MGVTTCLWSFGLRGMFMILSYERNIALSVLNGTSCGLSMPARGVSTLGTAGL